MKNDLEPISLAESNRLTILEGEIKANEGAMLKIADALTEIRDSRLYRNEFKTFKEYCEVRLEISRSRGYQLINFSKMSTTVDKPANENQAREIRRAARVPLAQASEPTSRGETISGGEMVHNEPAAVSSVFSSAATGTNLTPTAEKVIEEADVLIENMKLAIDLIKGGTIDCKVIKDLIAENSKMSRWLMALAAEIC